MDLSLVDFLCFNNKGLFIIEISEFILQYESKIRLYFFILGFSAFFLLGLIKPFRQIIAENRLKRWVSNSALTTFNSIVVRLILPSGLVFFMKRYDSFGLLNLFDGGEAFKFILGVIFLDFAIYWQHRLFHAVPLFWRLHRVHHTDIEFDVTTALRFHTIEILLSYVFKALVIITAGVPASAVIFFEILLNFCAMFNHGNYRLPSSIERACRFILVTPCMHRVHHSILKEETNSNYGFCLSLWDRIFNSYIKETKEDSRNMLIGIETHRDSNNQGLLQLILQPFK